MTDTATTTNPTTRQAPTTIVAIGSSAGGLEALRSLLHRLPKSEHFSYVVAQHLSPQHVSMLTTLLSRETSLNVVQVSHEVEVRRGTIYVTPPNHNIVYRDGHWHLENPNHRGPKPSIDTLLYSLATQNPLHSIGVILSGSGSDGSVGARQLKNAGGILVVQDPKSAKYPSMPQSAIATGLADAILPPEEIGPYLESIVVEPRPIKALRGSRRRNDEVDQILERINVFTNIDFRGYKTNTIMRRIQQRMSATQCLKLSDYLELLDQNNEEIQNLAQNCLISVTSFFRDPKSFEALESILAQRVSKTSAEPYRVWVPGCATGEEAYSLSILLARVMPTRRVQIFATDLDENAIAVGRKAVYPAVALHEVTPEVLNTHFVETASGFQLERAIRERVVFARHDLIRDPLFLKLDLISCRNLLIYFKQAQQEEVFHKFHHALNDSGLLFLGRSESVSAEFFDSIDRKFRIYINKPLGQSERRVPVAREWKGLERNTDQNLAAQSTTESLLRNALIDHFAPKAVLVDDSFRILESFGDVNRYLTLSEGKANFTLLGMLPKGLGATVRAQIQRSANTGQPVRNPGRQVVLGNKKINLETVAVPIDVPGQQRHFVLSFRETQASKLSMATTAGLEAEEQLRELEHELQTTRESLQAAIEELETSNEELQALNEEMQAANEELQASNEELNASNEELQSTNEELLTVNEEIEHKSIELTLLNEDLENIQNSLDSPLIVADARGYFRHVNEDAKRLFGLSGDQMVGPVLVPNDHILATQMATRIHQVINTGETATFPYTTNSRHFLVIVRPYQGRHKANRGAVVVFHEQTSLVQANDKMRRSETRLKQIGMRQAAMLDAVPAAMAVLDARGTIISVNAGWKRFAMENGFTGRRFGIGRNYIEVCIRAANEGATDAALATNGLNQVLKGKLPFFSFDYPCHSPSSRHWYRCLMSPVAVDGAGPHGALVLHLEITEHVLRQERASKLVAALETQPHATFIVDLDGRIEWMNEAFCQLCGYTPEELLHQSPSLLDAPEVSSGFPAHLNQARVRGVTRVSEAALQAKDGTHYIVRQTITPINNPDGTPSSYVVTHEDVTEKKSTAARMQFISDHDELTGLLNRKCLIQRLTNAIERQQQTRGTLALLFLDLDRFKDTNDTLGHLVGDQILIEVAQRLRAAVPESSNLARFGGDEFVLFVENPADEDEIEMLVDRILVGFSRPVLINERPLQISTSIGLALFPVDGDNAKDLLRNADLAMYRAKADGRRGYRRFDIQLEDEIRDRVLIERDLARALSAKDMWVAFQPQHDLATGEIIGAEALLRWRHDLEQDVPISKAVSIAEESGLILPIGEWVIKESIGQLKRWHREGHKIRLSVNLSAVQFNQQDVFALILGQLAEVDLPPASLKVEITETVLLNRSSRVMEGLHALHGAGVGLYLDDFGTGYSSLTYLQQFPIEAVKIDSSFLAGVGRDKHDEAIVDGIVKLAHSLGMVVVAEGVEKPEQIDFLLRSGCDFGQGYHFGRPLESEVFMEHLRRSAVPQSARAAMA